MKQLSDGRKAADFTCFQVPPPCCPAPAADAAVCLASENDGAADDGKLGEQPDGRCSNGRFSSGAPLLAFGMLLPGAPAPI